MGRGKKKGDKNVEKKLDISSLTISDSQSTAQTSAVAPREEANVPVASERPSESTSVASESVDVTMQEELEDVGLGLTGGGRKKKKKPKTAVQAQQPEPSAQSVPTPSQTVSEPSDVSTSVAHAPVSAEMQEESEGLGLGLTGVARRTKKKKPKTASQEQTGPQSGPPIQVVPTPASTVSVEYEQQGVAPDRGEPSLRGHGRGAGRGRPRQEQQPRPPGQVFSTPTPTGFAEQRGVAPDKAQSKRLGPGRPSQEQQKQPGPLGQVLPSPASSGFMTHEQRGQVQLPTKSYSDVQGTTSSQLSLVKSGSEPVKCRFEIPAKISGGKVRCKLVKVTTNYLPMKLVKPLKIHRYDISFKPDKPKKMIPKVFEKARNKNFPQHLVAFDQMKNCYTLHPLPNIPSNDRFVTNVEVVDNNNKVMNFEVSIKATGVVDFRTLITHMMSGGGSLSTPTEVIQCIDVILRQGTLESYIKAGRQFFKRPREPINLGDGLEMWTGLFQSAIFTSQAFINIDVAHKGFPKHQPLCETMTKDFQLDLTKPVEQQRRGVESFLEFIKGLRVVATIGGDRTKNAQKREFICNGLVDVPSKIFFNSTDASGRQYKISVADYFLREKSYRIRYPNLNCMWVGPRDKTIYYPIELLEVSYGQVLNKQLNDRQLSTMVREAATPPHIRMQKIQEVISAMNYSKNTYFKEFGLEISNEFFKVEAKVLHPPNLIVSPQRAVEPRLGVWRSDRLYKPVVLRKWGFIGLETDVQRSGYENIKKLLMSASNEMGMGIEEPKITYFNVNMRDLMKCFLTALEMDVKFLFVVVSSRGRDYYHRVKKIAECDVGILTQCIKEYTASSRMTHQTIRNILLKVNSKLMGINQALENRLMPNCLKTGRAMVVGADVTHPSPDQKSIPSIAAVTASIDPEFYIYNIELSIQTPKKEMIVEFEDMMVDHLQAFQKRLKCLPTKFFVFRDGVSEGQFAEVMNSELQAVYNAFRRMSGSDKKPEVLFLLVQKRHHTRMFLEVQRSVQNVEPGTVIDTHIVHPKELDFYLVSHQAIKGTARPTRYHAVCNDGKIPDDEVEQLAYYLCHLYSRCMRAVSYPTPTYYAHLACLRARSLTFDKKFDNAALEKKPERLRVLDKILDNSRMFFV